MYVLVKCYCPEYYDAASHAVIEITPDLIKMLRIRVAQAKHIFKEDFYGTKWWDYCPEFLNVGGPDSIGLEMDEEEFDSILDSNGYIPLPNFDPAKFEFARMSPVVLTVCASKTKDGVSGGFYWTGTDKYEGSCRVETFEMTEAALQEWADLLPVKNAKFTVEIPEVHKSIITVEAPEGTRLEELLDRAKQLFEEDGEETLEYSHTMERDHWTVRTEGGDYVV